MIRLRQPPIDQVTRMFSCESCGTEQTDEVDVLDYQYATDRRGMYRSVTYGGRCVHCGAIVRWTDEDVEVYNEW